MYPDDANPMLLAMLKAPRPGEVKTRLALDVGPEAAAAIYRRLVERQMSAIPPEWPVEVHYAPAQATSEIQPWLGARPSYHPQHGQQLGERLIHAIAGAFARGAGAVIVIGGDCPGLDEPTLREAANALASADVVLGPALDGGYYLIGLRQPAPDLFREISWSSPTVLASTLSRVRRAGLSCAMLAPKEDVDDMASWRRLESLLAPVVPVARPPDECALVDPA